MGCVLQLGFKNRVLHNGVYMALLYCYEFNVFEI